MIVLFVLVLLGSLWIYTVIAEKKRQEGLDNLATKYNLEVNPRWPIAPDPNIHGWIFPASYTRYMQGRIHGVAVVAFDYNIGFGRSKRTGSCVGVQRNISNAHPHLDRCTEKLGKSESASSHKALAR